MDPLFRGEVVESRRTRIHGEIILTQPIRIHFLVAGLLAVIILFAAWIAAGTYARTEAARGILATQRASAKIVAVRPGQVTEMLVREGDLVQAGQRLATVRTEQADEAGASAIDQSLTAIESQRILAQEQIGLAGQRAGSNRARLTATLAGLARQRADLEAQIALQEQTVVSARDLFERIDQIKESGFVSLIEVERRRQLYLAAQQDLARLNQQRNQAIAETSRTAAELTRVATDAASEVVVARSSAEALAQQSARLRGERAYAVLAPISGRVTALQTALGRSADPSIPLMEIVPEGSDLTALVYAPTRAIGFVRPGQEVRLLYDAFPYQRFGSFGGRVVSVSRTVIDPRHLAAPLGVEEPVYRIEIVPESQSIAAFDEQLPLQPGMTLTANLILDRRSFLDWLLTPVNAVMRRTQ